jgi:hypothetical protein
MRCTGVTAAIPLLTLVTALSGCPESKAASAVDAGTSGGDAGVQAVVGSFTISLVAPTGNDSSGHTTLVGKVYDGPTPAQVIWQVAQEIESCRLSTPRVPFCSEPCGGSAVCVEDDMCQPYPTAHSVGTVRVTGVKTTSGANEFAMEPVAKTYQPPAGVQLPFPAFEQGDAIRVEAKGGDFSAFSLAARGVSPLELADNKLALERGSPFELAWSPSGALGVSQIHVKLDVSHHGGTKGMIECDADDNGALSIAPELVTALLDLGAAGYPTVIVTRHSDGSSRIAPGLVNLSVASIVEKDVQIPGLASCTSNSECPSGQKCQSDLTCK